MNRYCWNGIPRVFRTQCRKKKFREAGCELFHHATAEIPEELDNIEWNRRLEELNGLVVKYQQNLSDVANLSTWFEAHYIDCMKLIPIEERVTFIAGVCDAHRDEIAEI